MKFNNTFLLMLAFSFLFALVACDRAKTVEYYNTHEPERAAKIEQCRKMNPVDLQSDRDCQAAIRSWSIADNKRFFGTDKKERILWINLHREKASWILNNIRRYLHAG